MQRSCCPLPHPISQLHHFFLNGGFAEKKFRDLNGSARCRPAPAIASAEMQVAENRVCRCWRYGGSETVAFYRLTQAAGAVLDDPFLRELESSWFPDELRANALCAFCSYRGTSVDRSTVPTLSDR